MVFESVHVHRSQVSILLLCVPQAKLKVGVQACSIGLFVDAPQEYVSIAEADLRELDINRYSSRVMHVVVAV